MRFWVTLEGRDAEVEFQAEGDCLWVEVEGRRLEADFRRLPDGEVHSLLIGGRSHEVRVSAAGPVLEVTLDGATVPVEVRHPLEKLLQSTQAGERAAHGEVVAAPMPGLVVAIKVRPGDRVEAGQPVAVVEAMKMQNELPALRGGVVRDVLVKERDSVSAGQPLVRLAPVEGA
jgi:biotin carboxyl carrier protein